MRYARTQRKGVAYCRNNPVNSIDSSGHGDVAVTLTGGALEAFTAWLSYIAGTNWWNPVGWAAAAALAVGVVVVAVFLYDYFLDEHPEYAASENEEPTEATGPASSDAVAPASPQPPNNNNNNNRNNNRNNHNERDFVKARTNKTANKWAQRADWDSAEAFKRDFVWNQGSRFDMYYDRAADMLLLIEKATGQIVETGVTFIR